MKIAFLPDLATNWQPLQQQLATTIATTMGAVKRQPKDSLWQATIKIRLAHWLA